MVGSGAGGGVIAAECAEAGKDVLVLEMGGYRNESDFKQLELPGYFELYYGGGLAGLRVGLDRDPRRPDARRRHGRQLHELRPHARPRSWPSGRRTGSRASTTPSFVTEHMDVVMERIGANTEATKQNNTHQKLIAGCDELGYEHRPIWRNASLDDDPEFCGYCPMGCQQGCKRSAMKTWLQDASDAGGALRGGLPRRPDPGAEDGRAAGRRGDRHARRRLDHRADGRVLRRRGGLRLDRVAGAAAAQRHRRARRRQEPAPAPGLRGDGRLRRADRGLEAARSSRRCRTTSSTSRTAAAS